MKTYTKTTLLSLFFIFNYHNAFTQHWQWAKGITSTEFVQILGSAVDSVGNIYCTGEYAGTVDFDPGVGNYYVTLPPSTSEGFYAKYSPTGDLIWLKTMDRSGAGISVQIDNAGSVYFSGWFSDSLLVSGDTTGYLFGSVCQNTFIIKSDNNGNVIWKKAFIAPVWITNTSTVAMEMALDKYSNLYFSGYYNSSSDFDPGPATYYLNTNNSNWHQFFVKLDSDGNFVWAKSFGEGQANVHSITSCSNGDLILYGGLYGSVDFDFDAITPPTTDSGFFVCRVDTSGSLQFLKILRSIGYSSSIFYDELKLDDNDNIYLTGSLYQTVDFDPGPSNFILSPYNDFDDDIFICALDNQGNFKWAKSLTSPNRQIARSLAIDENKNIYIVGAFTDFVDFDPGPGNFNLSADTTYANAFLSIYDSLGNFKNAYSFGGSQWGAGVSQIYLNQKKDILLLGTFSGTCDLDPGPATYNLGSGSGVLGTSYFSKFIHEANLINGKTYIDLNCNGLLDVGEPIRSNVLTEVNPGQFYFNSDPNGNYSAVVDTGNFSVTVPVPIPYYTSNPSFQTGLFSTLNNIDSLNNFGFCPLPGVNDLRISITALSPPSLFQPHQIQVTYSNHGTTVINGSLTLISDPDLIYLGSTVTPSQFSGDTIIWNYTALQPFETRNIIITDSVNIAFSDSLASIICYIFPIVGDAVISDNSDSIMEILQASYDPNFKEVLPSGAISPAQVNNSDYLNYTIHFQNTGTDTARTVIINDTLSSNLIFPTFEILSSSFPVTYSFLGSNIIRFRFDNILLPDSGVNQVLSHGFVKYRIRLKPNLTIGNLIENTAYIYFDFNDPVQTNTIKSVIGFTSINDIGNSEDLIVSPNPSDGIFTIQLNSNCCSKIKIEVYDLLGKNVYLSTNKKVSPNFKQTINLSNIKSGLYILKVSGLYNTFFRKIIID